MANEFLSPSFYTNEPPPKAGVGLPLMQSNARATLDLAGAKPPQNVEILDGAVTPTGAYCVVDTEGQSPADDLTVINPIRSEVDVIHEGMILQIAAVSVERVVTVKNSAEVGGIRTISGQDIVLGTTWRLDLQYIGGSWVEIASKAKKDIDDVAATFSIIAAIGKSPVATADAEGNPSVDDSWKDILGGLEITQTINEDPELASAEMAPSEKAVSTSLQEKVDSSAIQYKCIYGTGQAPAGDPHAIEDDALGNNGVIGANSRYVLDNPFTGSQLVFKAEIFYNNKWGNPEWVDIYASGDNTSYYGVRANNFETDIVVQTGQKGVLGLGSVYNGSPFGSVVSLTSAPCRIHVWKIGV